MPTPSKPCEVLVDGEWVPATLLSWRQDPDGWKAAVRYTRVVPPSSLSGLVTSASDKPMPFTWERTLPAECVRPPRAERLQNSINRVTSRDAEILARLDVRAGGGADRDQDDADEQHGQPQRETDGGQRGKQDRDDHQGDAEHTE